MPIQSEVTAYGAILESPARAASVLRARAAAGGISLHTASALDLAAATLAAHCWAVALGRTSVVGTMTPAQASGLAAALARAAGQGVQDAPGADDCLLAEDLPDAALRRIAPVAAWAAKHAGVPALRVAAGDLSASSDPRVAAVARALILWEMDA